MNFLYFILILAFAFFVAIPLISYFIYWLGNSYFPWIDDKVTKLFKKRKRSSITKSLK